jgi:hypothetical protein
MDAVAQRVLASAVRARDPESLDRRHLIQDAVLLAVRVDPCPELAATRGGSALHGWAC